MTDDTILHRQINPGWVQNGRVTSQAFRPTPKDEFKLSLYDGDMITAEASWEHFRKQGLESVGVLSLTRREFAAEGVPCYSSPTIFVEHVHADYAGLTDGQMRAKGKRLLSVAVKRGWQYKI